MQTLINRFSVFKPVNLLNVSLLSLSCCFISFNHADNLRIPVGQQGETNIERPRTGMTKMQVKNRYGNAQNEIISVGNPPVSSWVYPDFTVYFEHNHVIHSVINHKPKHPDSSKK